MINTTSIQGLKYTWLLPAVKPMDALQIAADYNLSLPIAQILLARGFITKELIDQFLFTSFDTAIAHMGLMKDAQKAIDRIVRAIEHKEKILIFGDYDVDGITSSAMMMQCLKLVGADVNFFLPNRVRDGYGLSTKVVQKAADNGYSVVITVDNGVTAFEPAALAKKLGIDLIITDHHQPHGHLPEAFALINPHQQECNYPYKLFAGVGVTFKVLSFLFARLGKELPQKVYELLLLGTVADVVPLTGENRFWVRYGLQYVNRQESLAFKVLKENGKLTKPLLSSLDIGFSIAPQINALGRLDDPRDGVKFLIGSHEQEVARIGKVLLELNQARREIERGIFVEIEASIKAGAIDLSKENIVMAASKNWPAGVIGLVGSRLVGEYGRPALLFHLTKDGVAKGSCRSISAFNMFEALESCKDLLVQFGGHAQAAGLAIKIENLPKLKERLEERIAQQLTPFDLQQKLTLDAQTTLPELTKKFMEDMQHLEPFGHQNDVPRFYIKNVVQVQKPVLLKDAHVKCTIFADGVIKPVIFFNKPTLFDVCMKLGSQPFDLAAQVMENHWNGNINIELQGLDIAVSQ